jgi:copper chaperone CopZ
MYSRRCVRVISARVSDVVGVRSLKVDLITKIVRVTGSASAASVRAAIRDAGYAVAAGTGESPEAPSTGGMLTQAPTTHSDHDRHHQPGAHARSRKTAVFPTDPSGPHREDLVMVEVDEAAMHINITHRPAIPDDPQSPVIPWTPWISRLAMLGVYDLVPTPDGSYKPAQPWSPTYP